MDDETWGEVVKVVAPSIIKMNLSNVACVLAYFILLTNIFPLL